MKLFSWLLLVAFAFNLAACAPQIPEDALKLSPTSLEDREKSTRRYDTNESNVLSASAQALQDLGFQLDESETKLGVLVASKKSDATDYGQIGLMVAVALLGGGAQPVDKEQMFRASVVSQSVGTKSTKVRVTFQRVVWNTQGQMTRIEAIHDPKYYQGFFDKLSESVFLEGHKI